MIESKVQSPRWVELRERWMAMVVARANSQDWPAEWQQSLPKNLQSDEQEVAAIASLWEPPVPAYYCHYAVETENYPVPADLKALTTKRGSEPFPDEVKRREYGPDTFS
jgi:hypothetical protein